MSHLSFFLYILWFFFGVYIFLATFMKVRLYPLHGPLLKGKVRLSFVLAPLVVAHKLLSPHKGTGQPPSPVKHNRTTLRLNTGCFVIVMSEQVAALIYKQVKGCGKDKSIQF